MRDAIMFGLGVFAGTPFAYVLFRLRRRRQRRYYV
jgi:hypothetical protein